MDIPNLAVLRDRFANGLESFDKTDDIYHADCTKNILQAFEHTYKTDAHFVTYHIPGEEAWPRLNKPILSRIREKGSDIKTRYVALDFDNPNHLPWTTDFLAQWVSVLKGQSSTFLGDWFCHYTTKSGARLVYILDRDLTVDDSEHFVRLIQREWGIHTPTIDKNTADWTRLFRMPKVLRSGERTEDSDYFHIEFQDKIMNVAAARMLFSAEAPQQSQEEKNFDVTVNHEMLPNDFDAKELIETSVDGRYRLTKWGRDAKKRLKGRECFDLLFGDEELTEGERDTTLTSYMGQACSMLYGQFGTTKTHIYGLFYDILVDLDPDEGTRDWLLTGWRKIERFWAVEESKHQELKAQGSMRELDKRETFDVILERMRGWTGHGSLDDDNSREKQFAFIKQCLIAKASTSKFYFIMNEKGVYDALPLDKDSIVSRIKALSLDHMYEMYTWDRDGEPTVRPINKILEDHCTTVKDIRLVPQIDGGYIQNLNGNAPILYLPSYRRNPNLVGVFNPHVDEWLEVAFGSNKPRIEEWIAWSLAFEEGATCAISIVGAGGIGKKLLVCGLSECLETPDIAFAEDLVGNFQGGLLSTPFLVVNEGWPKSRSVDPSIQFRKLTGGDPFVVNDKFKPRMMVSNPARIIFTANNSEVVKELMDGKDLSPDDRKAIGERLLHFEVDESAAVWFINKGGLEFTSRPGHRWIAGDGGQRSNYVVAKHFMYLYENRERYSLGNKGRLLVTGNVTQESDLMFDMMTQSGSAPTVLETLISFIERTDHTLNHIGWAYEHGNLYVLPANVLSHFRDNISQATKESLTLNRVLQVLRNLVESRTTRVELESKPDFGRTSWQHIDPQVILKAAERYGYKCDKLRKIVNGELG